MKKWSYIELKISEYSDAIMNRLGEEGWEVYAFYRDDKKMLNFYFKREIV